MMWSGDPQYSQWALNPSTYQNVAHEEVDWAALAQQWIQMKETHPSDQIPPAPPPPAIGDKSDSGDKKKDSELEGGEAPMDMDTKEDNSNSSNTQSGDANTWNTWPNWQQWGWNWSATGGMVPPGGVPPPNQSLVQGKGTTSTSAMTVPPYGYPHNSQAYTSGTGVYDYNHAGGSDQYSQYKDGRGMDQSQHVRRGSEVMASGYWTSGGPADTGGVPPGPGPSPFIRHNRHDWRRNNRSHDRLRTSEKSDDEEDTTTVLDAAKRRQLPAWIREGLEKMEREKQKKIDRERQIKEREAYLQKKREDEEHAMSELEKNAGQPMIPKKSKFESDSEESGRGDSPTPSQSSLKRKSRFRNADSPNSSPRHPAARFPSTEPEPVKSREELMQEVINTHPRLTIGVPPVRGSKATAPNRSSSSTNPIRFGRSSYRGSVPSSSSTRYASGPTSAASEHIFKHRNSTISHFGKTMSYSFKTPTTSEKQNPHLEFLNVPVHDMLDQWYPSVSTEGNRKPRGHCRNSSRAPLKYRVCSKVEEKPEGIADKISRQMKECCGQVTDMVTKVTLKIPRNELCVAEELLPSEEVSVEATVTIPKSNLNGSAGHIPSEVSTEATVIVPRSNLRTSKNLVASAVSVEATVAVPSQVADVSTTETVMNKLVEGMALKSGRKRHSAVVETTSSVLPPVIMDQQDQDSSENFERLSGLTFGFEVNEQLLLSDGDENSCSNSSELPSLIEESSTDLKSVSDNLTAKESISVLPVITNDASENFSSRFQMPVAERSELHDTIVAYVSGSWGAVVKEMHRGEEVVRYYSGQ